MSSAKYLICYTLICGLVIGGSAQARQSRPGTRIERPTAAASPAYCVAEHNVGNIVLSVTNHATFGSMASATGTRDCFTGQQVRSCEYPKGSRTMYLWASDLWVGAIRGTDTMVSSGPYFGQEFAPDVAPFGNMIYRSTIDPALPAYEGAISEQDYIARYADTCTQSSCGTTQRIDFLDGRRHLPLGIEVTQRSFAWSYSYADDFVLFDYEIKNIGDDRLRQVYLGIFLDSDVGSLGDEQRYIDDLSGFRQYLPAQYLRPPCPSDSDEVNLAWTVDNDGDFNSVYGSARNVAATRVVRTPADSLVVSYNWWVRPDDNPELDYGPQAYATFRDLQTGGTGNPTGDRNMYHYLSNGEMDFDQPEIASIGQWHDTWLPPPAAWVDIWATGLDVRYLLSFGPFAIEPGQTLPISYAYVCGSNFHRTQSNFDHLPDDPLSWYEGVNFDSLGVNATWADWIYDNPGVDTDSDGYYGEFTVCNLGEDSTWKCDTVWDTIAQPDTILMVDCYYGYDIADTVWRKGDGVPDFRGASPPPSPAAYTIADQNGSGEFIRGLRVETSPGEIRLIWNGVLSESTRDVFSREIDFEGYRVWLARDSRPTSFSVAASFDIEDFNRWEWDSISSEFSLIQSPFSLLKLRSMYASSPTDQNWHPSTYTRSNPLVIPGTGNARDEIFYFTPQDHNRSRLGNDSLPTTDIRKVYPEAPRPSVLDPDSVRAQYANFPDSITAYLTDEGFIKYYEYEYTFDNLLPTVSYWMNVTTFDYGSPKSGLSALETQPGLLPIVAYPLALVDQSDSGDQEGREVLVYPNPYRNDGDYLARGYEGRGEATSRSADRLRRIHFANLPATCVLRIYSLDGDLVREIEHEVDSADPLASHETWDMITRNSQLVVSGLYYWTVEDDSGGVQVGKLAIIM